MGGWDRGLVCWVVCVFVLFLWVSWLGLGVVIFLHWGGIGVWYLLSFSGLHWEVGSMASG